MLQETEVKLIDGEALASMEGIERAELVSGRVIEHMPTGHTHGHIEALIAAFLVMFNLKYKLGRVLTGEAGVYTKRNPDTVRGMDVAFISNERYAQNTSKSFLDIAPEIIVEIMSPDDRWSYVQTKINEYFNINAQEVWVVDPQLQQIHQFTAPDEFKLLTIEDSVQTQILPEFSMPLIDILDLNE